MRLAHFKSATTVTTNNLLLKLRRKRFMLKSFVMSTSRKKCSISQLVLIVFAFSLLKIALEFVLFRDNTTIAVIDLDEQHSNELDLSRWWKSVLFRTLQFKRANTPESDEDLIHFVRGLIRWPRNLNNKLVITKISQEFFKVRLKFLSLLFGFM